jgi:hypothetical protein
MLYAKSETELFNVWESEPAPRLTGKTLAPDLAAEKDLRRD